MSACKPSAGAHLSASIAFTPNWRAGAIACVRRKRWSGKLKTWPSARRCANFFFVDSVFNDPREHALAICRELGRRRLPVRWSAFCNPAGFDAELARAMKQAGCDAVEFGQDVASAKMLEALGKPFGQAETRIALQAARDAGLPFVIYLLFGGPGETWADVQDTQNFLNGCAPAHAVFATFGIRIYEGTPAGRDRGAGRPGAARTRISSSRPIISRPVWPSAPSRTLTALRGGAPSGLLRRTGAGRRCAWAQKVTVDVEGAAAVEIHPLLRPVHATAEQNDHRSPMPMRPPFPAMCWLSAEARRAWRRLSRPGGPALRWCCWSDMVFWAGWRLPRRWAPSAGLYLRDTAHSEAMPVAGGFAQEFAARLQRAAVAQPNAVGQWSMGAAVSHPVFASVADALVSEIKNVSVMLHATVAEAQAEGARLVEVHALAWNEPLVVVPARSWIAAARQRSPPWLAPR